jgi:hypothetical protein
LTIERHGIKSIWQRTVQTISLTLRQFSSLHEFTHDEHQRDS